MEKYFYTFIILLTVTAFLQQQQEIEHMERLLSDQTQSVVALKARQSKHEQHIRLALHLGRNTQKTLYDSRAVRVVKVTAYSPRLEETDSTPHTTAANTRVRPGIIAVSRDLFNKGWIFGRKVYIKSLGIFTIEDLMAKRKTNQIDIFMGDTTDAINFGKQNLEAYLLASPPPKGATFTELYKAPSQNLTYTTGKICSRKDVSARPTP